jgi:hypothetical protein
VVATPEAPTLEDSDGVTRAADQTQNAGQSAWQRKDTSPVLTILRARLHWARTSLSRTTRMSAEAKNASL